MLLRILIIYLLGILVIGFPMLEFCYEKNLLSQNEIVLAIIMFYPIVIVALFVYGIIIAIKGLLEFIKLLFKGGLF